MRKILGSLLMAFAAASSGCDDDGGGQPDGADTIRDSGGVMDGAIGRSDEDDGSVARSGDGGTGGESETDAAVDAPHDAYPDTCPVGDPDIGTRCHGNLRCIMDFHGDCVPPRPCPAGCSFSGPWPGGVSYAAVCENGVWVQEQLDPDCPDPDDVVCACPDGGDDDAGG